MGSGPPGPPLAFHGPNSHKERSHMARTPLLSRFQELFEDFDEADRSGLSVESVQEERRQMRSTRRDILKACGAAVAAAAPRRTLAPLAVRVTPTTHYTQHLLACG